MRYNPEETTNEEEKKAFQEIAFKRTLKANADHLKELDYRAKSVTVGTAFGGVSEIGLRRGDGTITFALLQPVEVIELIHQLSASIGCHIHIQPRKDFSSWRKWKHTEEELEHFRGVGRAADGSGHPPHLKCDDEKYLTSLPNLNEQPGLQSIPQEGIKTNEETVATQKTV